MKVNGINLQTAKQKWNKIGAFTGTAVACGSIVKNRKDIFDKVLEQAGNTPKNKALIGAACAIVVGASALIGRTLGGVVGRIVDKHNAKKNAKTNNPESIQTKNQDDLINNEEKNSFSQENKANSLDDTFKELDKQLNKPV